MPILVKFSINFVDKVVLPDPDQPASPNKGGNLPSICWAKIRSWGEFKFVKGSNSEFSKLSKST